MFRMSCDNKGCGKDVLPQIDTKTNEVYCPECNKTVKGISSFMKAQLKGFGQVKSQISDIKAFSVTCQKCNGLVQPIVTKDTIKCSVCAETLKVSQAYAQMLRSLPKAE